MTSESSRPITGPNLPRGNVTSLSTITCDTERSPFVEDGSTVIRKSGAPTRCDVSGATVMLS